MDWVQRMNTAINYIEHNLTAEIDKNEISKITMYPIGLFQRIFTSITGIGLAEYIRRRRLSLAAIELLNCNSRIIDIAIKYGYSSSDAFSLAFKRLHNVTPSEARALNKALVSYPRLSFNLKVKGDIELNYRIFEKEAFEVAGFIAHMPDDKNNNVIKQLWDTCIENGEIKRLELLAKDNPLMGLLFDEDNGAFKYMIAYESKDKNDLQTMQVPKYTWAAFECVGAMPHALQKVWNRVFTEFLPQSGYRYSGTPFIEVYFQGDKTADNYKCELWIPVIKE